jgi:hypothetical protein
MAARLSRFQDQLRAALASTSCSLMTWPMKPERNRRGAHKSFQRAAASRCSPSRAACLYKSVRVGTANVVLMNRSIVSPACITGCPRWISSPSDIANDMNAQKLPIVPTKDQLHKAISAGPVRHSTGRLQTGRLRGYGQIGSVLICPGLRSWRSTAASRASANLGEAQDSRWCSAQDFDQQHPGVGDGADEHQKHPGGDPVDALIGSG